jgi:probable HAF family extracellular repeat protein
MWFTSSLRQRTNGKGVRCRPHVEPLERRDCPSSTYTVLDLGTLGGGTYSEAHALNDTGLVVGEASDSTGSGHAACWRVSSGGAVTGTLLPELSPGRGSNASAVNNNGQILCDAGVLWQPDGSGGFVPLNIGFTISWSDISDADAAGHVWLVGTYETFDSVNGYTDHARLEQLDTAGNVLKLLDFDPSAFSADANGINNFGQIAGVYRASATATPHAVVWQVDADGNLVSRTDLGTLPGSKGSGGHDVNSSGNVAGASSFVDHNGNGYSHATLWKNGTVTDLGTLLSGSGADAINDAGVIVGNNYKLSHQYLDSSTTRAFVWKNGVMSDLNRLIPSRPAWTLLEARDINNAGQIVGRGVVGTSNLVHAYLLEPAATPLATATRIARSSHGQAPSAASSSAVRVPFTGTFAGQAVSAVPTADPDVLFITTAGSGQATELGAYTFVSPHFANLATGQASGTQVFTAANGDTITAEFSGQFLPTADGHLRAELQAIITTGTGRFSGVTGSYTFDIVFDPTTLTSTATITGWLVIVRGR